MIDDVDVAYRQAVGIFASGVNHGHGIFHEPLNGHATPSGAPFFPHNAPLFVYLLIAETKVMAPVTQYEQAGIYHTFS